MRFSKTLFTYSLIVIIVGAILCYVFDTPITNDKFATWIGLIMALWVGYYWDDIIKMYKKRLEIE